MQKVPKFLVFPRTESLESATKNCESKIVYNHLPGVPAFAPIKSRNSNEQSVGNQLVVAI